jgi:hypothetical protein
MDVRPLSIKIFQDSISPAKSLEPIEIGIDVFRETAPAIDVHSTTSKIYVPDSAERYIRTDCVEPKQLGVDLGILVTRRALLTRENVDKYGGVRSYTNKDGSITAGIAINGLSLRRQKLAIVWAGDDPTDLSVSSTVTHELAHLVNVKAYGEAHDDGHCVTEGCVMGESVSDGNYVSWDFCWECKPQVAEHVSILSKIKSNLRVSEKRAAKLVQRNPAKTL